MNTPPPPPSLSTCLHPEPIRNKSLLSLFFCRRNRVSGRKEGKIRLGRLEIVRCSLSAGMIQVTWRGSGLGSTVERAVDGLTSDVDHQSTWTSDEPILIRRPARQRGGSCPTVESEALMKSLHRRREHIDTPNIIPLDDEQSHQLSIT